MTDSPSPQWYDNGLRFECTACGNCCTGPPGMVWFTEDEGRAIAQNLSISETEFYRQYTRLIHGRRSLNEHKTEHGYDCIFLDRDSTPGKALCSIYKARPTQCRTWPFWPENLRSHRAWSKAKRKTPCPGMDQGKLIPVESIRIQHDATP